MDTHARIGTNYLFKGHTAEENPKCTSWSGSSTPSIPRKVSFVLDQLHDSLSLRNDIILNTRKTCFNLEGFDVELSVKPSVTTRYG